MPGGDRTGPNGAGAMTGRAAGYCAGYPVPGYANPARGYSRRGGGRGYCRGWGRCYGRDWYNVPPTSVPPVTPQANLPTTQQPLPEQEVAALENYHKNLTAEKTDLDQELADVKAKIDDLKTKIVKK